MMNSGDVSRPRVAGSLPRKEFGDIRRYPPGSHAGLILLRLSQESRADYLRLAGRVPTQIKLDEINGAIVVVTGRGIRVRS